MHLLVLLCVLPGCRKSTFEPMDDTGPGGSLDEVPATDDTGDPGEVTEDDTGPADSDPDSDSDPSHSDPPDSDPPDTAPIDADGDGYTADVDCVDDDERVHPGAEETCDGRDEDCDDDVDEDAVDVATWWLDLDGDGFGSGKISEEACTPSSGYVAEAGDCDDVDADVNPDADEVCDGDDEDCDGLVDDDDDSLDLGTASTWYADADGDGYGDPDDSVVTCEQPTAYTDVAGDCDDSDDTTYEGSEEICNDGVDNDCDDSSDGCALEATYDLADADVALWSNGEDDHAEQDGDASLADAHATLTGAASGDLAGVAVAVVGDVDGDGAPDVIVGATDADPGGSASGEAYLLYGPVSGTIDLGSADVVLDGESANDRAGSAVAGGDFDGTGYADLVISAPYDDTEADDGGAAYLLMGQGF